MRNVIRESLFLLRSYPTQYRSAWQGQEKRNHFSGELPPESADFVYATLPACSGPPQAKADLFGKKR